MPAMLLVFKRLGPYRTNFSLLDIRKWTDTDAQTVLQIHTILLMTSPHIKVDITLPMRDMLRISLWLFARNGPGYLPKGYELER